MAENTFPDSEEERQANIQAVLKECQAEKDLGHLGVLQSHAFADLIFQFGKETVAAHTCIVQKRCEALMKDPAIVKKSTKRKNQTTVQVKEGALSQDALGWILSYLYSGSIDLKSMKNENILQLVAAAKKVKLARLLWLCEHYLQENLTMDNVFSILKHSHEMKEADVKSFCLAYAVQYYNKFIANKDGVRLLGIDLFQEVASASAEKGAAKKLPNDPAPPCTLVKDFNAIYNEMVNADGFVKCGGQTIKFHKAVLGASSPEFANLLGSNQSREDWGDATGTGQGIDISNVDAPAFTGFLKYIYYHDENIEPRPACQLIAFANKYKLKNLESLCSTIIKNNVTVDSVLPILGVTYLPQMKDKPDLTKDLRGRAIKYVVTHLAEVDLAPLRKMDQQISVDILLARQDFAKNGPSEPEPAAPAEAESKSEAKSDAKTDGEVKKSSEDKKDAAQEKKNSEEKKAGEGEKKDKKSSGKKSGSKKK